LVPHTAYETHGGPSNGPLRTFAILAESLPTSARTNITPFRPSPAAAKAKTIMADPPVVLGREEKATLVASSVQKVSNMLVFVAAALCFFCKLQLTHHCFVRSKINAQVVNHHLKPAEALILVNHGRPVGIKDYDLSRALAKLVSEVATKWVELEEKMLSDVDSSDDAAVWQLSTAGSRRSQLPSC
jgi:hypothetical protein